MKKILFGFLVISLAACASAPANKPTLPTKTQIQEKPTEKVATTFGISSPAFKNGEAIPSDYSCDGNDTSPSLAWTEPPAGTQSFALIVEDPDAPMGTWVHWVLFNIPASTRNLTEGTPTDAQLSDGSLQGKTSAGSNGYHGPCPPSGTHHYLFKLYALDTMLSLPANTDKKKLLSAMEGHILTNVELMGTFSH